MAPRVTVRGRARPWERFILRRYSDESPAEKQGRLRDCVAAREKRQLGLPQSCARVRIGTHASTLRIDRQDRQCEGYCTGVQDSRNRSFLYQLRSGQVFDKKNTEHPGRPGKQGEIERSVFGAERSNDPTVQQSDARLFEHVGQGMSGVGTPRFCAIGFHVAYHVGQ